MGLARIVIVALVSGTVALAAGTKIKADKREEKEFRPIVTELDSNFAAKRYGLWWMIYNGTTHKDLHQPGRIYDQYGCVNPGWMWSKIVHKMRIYDPQTETEELIPVMEKIEFADCLRVDDEETHLAVRGGPRMFPSSKIFLYRNNLRIVNQAEGRFSLEREATGFNPEFWESSVTKDMPVERLYPATPKQDKGSDEIKQMKKVSW